MTSLVTLYAWICILSSGNKSLEQIMWKYIPLKYKK